MVSRAALGQEEKSSLNREPQVAKGRKIEPAQISGIAGKIDGKLLSLRLQRLAFSATARK
jgi:hypothetical protein